MKENIQILKQGSVDSVIEVKHMVSVFLKGAYVDPRCQYIKIEFEDYDDDEDHEHGTKELWFPVEIITDIGKLEWSSDYHGYVGNFDNDGFPVEIIIEMINEDCNIFGFLDEAVQAFIKAIGREKSIIDEDVQSYIYFEERDRLQKSVEGRMKELRAQCRLASVTVAADGSVNTTTSSPLWTVK